MPSSEKSSFVWVEAALYDDALEPTRADGAKLHLSHIKVELEHLREENERYSWALGNATCNRIQSSPEGIEEWVRDHLVEDVAVEAHLHRIEEAARLVADQTLGTMKWLDSLPDSNLKSDILLIENLRAALEESE